MTDLSKYKFHQIDSFKKISKTTKNSEYVCKIGDEEIVVSEAFEVCDPGYDTTCRVLFDGTFKLPYYDECEDNPVYQAGG